MSGDGAIERAQIGQKDVSAPLSAPTTGTLAVMVLLHSRVAARHLFPTGHFDVRAWKTKNPALGGVPSDVVCAADGTHPIPAPWQVPFRALRNEDYHLRIESQPAK